MSDETWTWIKGYERLYKISDLGNVRSHHRRGIRPLRPNIVGPMRYRYVHLRSGGKRKAVALHVLVATHFIGPKPDGLEVAHADGDTANNAVTNLRWATHADNMRDKIAHGTHRYGELAGIVKLTGRQVREIRARAASGETHQSISYDYGVCRKTIGNIANGKTWRLVA